KVMCNKWPKARGIYIEDKANGTAVIEMLKKKISGIVPVTPDGGKEVRANAVAPLWEAGNIYLPHPLICPWVNDFIDELVAF
ncbi:phage terminase large subunit, partial [Enterococcus faecalis]